MLSTIYLIVLQWSTSAFLRPNNTYFALQMQLQPTWRQIAWAIFTSAVTALILPRRVRGAADFTLVVIFFVVCLPAGLISLSIDGTPAVFGPLAMATMLAVAVAARMLTDRGDLPPDGQMLFRDSSWPSYLIGGAAALFTLYMLCSFGTRLRLVGFAEVYELRSQVSGPEYVMYAYASGIYAGAIGPVATVYGLVRRNWVVAALGLAGFLWIYMASGNRSAIVSVFILILILLLKKRSFSVASFPMILSFATIAATSLDHFRGSLSATPLLVDRLLLAPSVLSTLYVSHFSSAEKTYWRHSVLNSFTDDTVPDPASTIGLIYFGPNDYANANFMAEGYANFGIAGSVLLFLLLIGQLVVLRRITSGYPAYVAIAATVPFTISVTNISPLTVILTGGFAFLVPLLLLAFPQQEGRGGRNHGLLQQPTDDKDEETHSGPLVSVIIPHYNSAGLGIEAIQSAIDQSITDTEIIVVDDCSTDGSWELVCETFGANPQVHLASMEKNSGSPAAPRNRGILLARGANLAFLDADDRWLPEKLAMQLEHMRITSAEMSATGYHIVNPDRVRVGSFRPSRSVTFRSLLLQNQFGCSTVVVRRSALGSHRFPPIGHEDYALWLTLVRGGVMASNIPDLLSEYMLRPHSVSRNKVRSLGFLWGVYRGHLGMDPMRAAWRTIVYALVATRRHKPPS